MKFLKLDGHKSGKPTLIRITPTEISRLTLGRNVDTTLNQVTYTIIKNGDVWIEFKDEVSRNTGFDEICKYLESYTPDLTLKLKG